MWSGMWTHRDLAAALNNEFRIGQVRRRHRGALLHRPSGRGKGKWQSLDSLRNYKAKSKRRRRIAEASRARNRAA